MSYNINYTDIAANPIPITVEDQSLNTDLSLTFIGKNYPGSYSTPIGENFLHLLENFASNSMPTNPITGQLWYKTGVDTSPAQPKLMVYDGTRWTEAGSVKKGTAQPAAEISVVGDLWVDTANQQLYLFTGAIWILVGPQFSQGSLSGIKAEELIDRDTNTGKFVLIFYVSDVPVIIISKDKFYPKVTIAGFTQLQPGVNLSTVDFLLDGAGFGKFWGTAEKSNSLVVGTSTVPAANFLRSDAVSTTNFTLNIRNGGGLTLGASLETSLTTSSAGAILNHRTPNSVIILRPANNAGSSVDVVTVTGSSRVGINNGSPDEALDVVGNVKTNGIIKTTNATSSTNTTSGALQVAGGVGIAGALNVGNNASITGHLTVGSASAGVAVTPRVNEFHDIGTSINRFRTVYAKNFTGDVFTGSFVGGLTGNVTGSATYLANTAQFSLRGDITSQTLPFNGSEPVPVRNISSVARTAFGVATVTTSVNHNYVSGYIAVITCSTSSFDTAASGAVITVTGLNTFTYQQSTSLPVVSTTSATGTVSIKAGGTFTTVLSDSVISDKTEVTNSLDSDYFLVYRAAATPPLRKINKATLFSTAGTVPTGSIFPFAGDTPPSGYLFCDGSEQSQSAYPALYSILGYKYKAAGLLTGYQTFALPDLRGRFALGKENMDNGNTVSMQISATAGSRTAITTIGAISTTFVVQNTLTTNGPFQAGKTLSGTGLDTSGGPVVITTVENNTPSSGYTTLTVSMPSQPTIYPSASGLTLISIGVTEAGGGTPTPSRVPSATTLGIVGGASTKTLTTNQLPVHGHLFDDMRWAEVDGIYSYNDPQLGTIAVGPGAGSNRGTDYDNGVHLQQHGTYNAGSGQAIDIMNPFQTINYIIFTGVIS
jgi:microcystin-dependent protein